MPEKIQNNLYLLREQIKEQHPRTRKILLKDIDFKYLIGFFKTKGFREQKIKDNLSSKFNIKVFYKKAISDVKWKDFIKTIVSPDEEILKLNKSTSESYIILFQNPNTNKIYASTGGYAHITVQELATTDFGIEILSRIVKIDDKALKSTKERNLTGGIQGEVKFFRNDYNLYENDSFGKIYNELNALLTKEVLSKTFGFNLKELKNNSLCIAKNSFSLKKTVSFNELLSIIDKCENLLTKKPTVEINNIDKLSKSEYALIQNLYEELIKYAFSNYKNNSDFYSIEISHKEFDKYFQASSTKLYFSLNRKKHEIEFEDAIRDIQAILDEIKKFCGENINFEDFNKIITTATLATFDENGEVLTRDRLLNHFCSEISFKNKTYFLIEKEWYSIKNSFIDGINEQTLYFLTENKYKGPKLDKWQGVSENNYNSSYIGKANSFVFDKFTYLNIEACDVLKIDSDAAYFYHIKKGFDNSMRDLCNQVLIAARKINEDVKSDFKYLKSLYDLVINNNGKSEYSKKAKSQFKNLTKKKFIDSLRNKKIVFVLAVLDTSVSKRNLFKEIENFDSNIAKFTLNELSKNMRNLGVSFQIAQLEK